jgi:hypothetical protein
VAFKEENTKGMRAYISGSVRLKLPFHIDLKRPGISPARRPPLFNDAEEEVATNRLTCRTIFELAI